MKRRPSLHEAELAVDRTCRRCGEIEHVLVKPSGAWSTHICPSDPLLDEQT